MHRVLNTTGSIFFHCDHAANGYVRTIMDSIFGTPNLRNAMNWYYKNASRGKRQWAKAHDDIFWYTKTSNWVFNRDNVLQEYESGMTKWRYQRAGKEPPAGKTPGDVLTMPALNTMDKERTGYPTQKPVALAERIILASSNPGDVVLDCFAGCAYVPVAAERNGRQWIACDISPRALTVLRRQFAKFNYAVDGEQNIPQPALIAVANVTTRGPHQLRARNDKDPVQRYDLKPLPERAFKVPASIIPDKEMLEFLLSLSGYTAWCCGFANQRPDGSIVKTTRNFHLDHLDPKSKEGSNQIYNRVPLCPYHNIRKNQRRAHLADYRQEIANAGEMMVDQLSELVNLAWAQQQAVDFSAIARMRSGIQPTLQGTT